ncbi:Cytochrome P450 3A24 [Trametes pubescens]|uniref:Cytochrome P450 3A24 n=1 Tax=Trametes pubescens TaxID=154538 RepID=A0A1M2VNS4_TRAPU|nr:Cytochrome P450 3A24 [Trametes pubescens]
MLSQYLVGAAVAYALLKLIRWLLSPKSPLDNVHGPPVPSWIAGHMLQLYDKQHGWGFHQELRTKYGPVSKLQFLFGKPLLYVYDPAAMQTIVLKEHRRHEPLFEELPYLMNIGMDTFGPGLLSTVGGTHRRQRKLLNPIFSPKNLRLATPTFYEVAHRLSTAIKTLVVVGDQQVDMAQYMARAALELIGQSVLGQCLDPLTEKGSNPYTEALKSYIPTFTALSPYFQFYRYGRPLIPTALRRPIMDLLPSRRVKALLRIIDTMHGNAVRIFEEKKMMAKSGEKVDDEGEIGKDLTTLFLKANVGASKEDALTEEELIAQLSTLIFAATDTTSNALTLVLECLAKNPEVQHRLRAELREAKSRHEGGDLPYDELMALPYLDAVCAETLRVHVPAPMRIREAQADAILPLSTPIRGNEGTLMHSIPVPKGTYVFIAIQAANVNPDLWGADAHEWRPERWLAPLPGTIAEAKIPGVYSNLMTFWGGGRSCIGFKFAQLEMKVVLAELISTFAFDKTDAPVVWNLGEVVHPTIGTDSSHPEYPMKVTLVQ